MSSKVLEDLHKQESNSPAGLSWVEELRRVSLAVSQGGNKPASSRNQLFYLLHWTPDASVFGITLYRGRDMEEAEAWWDVERALAKTPPFVTEQDVELERTDVHVRRASFVGPCAFLPARRGGRNAHKRLAHLSPEASRATRRPR